MNKKHFFVVCVSKEHYPELIFGKIYKALEDEQGQQEKYIRVFGESEEDYLFPESWFKGIELAKEIEQALLAS